MCKRGLYLYALYSKHSAHRTFMHTHTHTNTSTYTEQKVKAVIYEFS